jgi:hypothetical protein
MVLVGNHSDQPIFSIPGFFDLVDLVVGWSVDWFVDWSA